MKSTRTNNDVLPSQTDVRQRLRLDIRGTVQGVGFRPFIYRLATGLGLGGWVCNSAQGVQIEVEGPFGRLREFTRRIEAEQPPHSSIRSRDCHSLDPEGDVRFTVRDSDSSGEKTVTVLPDIATCPDCLADIFDPSNRRYRYPFTNCTNCGPRYSIVESLPYDRDNTTMKVFEMCPECQAEYQDPYNRRFHAQPNACPKCGPHLELWNVAGKTLATHDDALLAASDVIRQGEIVALKGLGGFQLLVDARNPAAVDSLRHRKARREKPFALMYPDLARIENDCEVSEFEQQLLNSPASPIVLLRRRVGTRKNTSEIASSVAPDNPYLGIMLPYTPLHHLLLAELGFPVVATSGNLTDEPICIDEYEALTRLGHIADAFLVHNRPIARHVDDSIARIVVGREQVLRNARGYAPLPLQTKNAVSPCLAVGAHLKNSVVVTNGTQVLVSQHVGDLTTKQAYDCFTGVIHTLSTLYDFRPELVACDMHPDYLSTRFAAGLGIPLIQVQHHYAHILSCMAEHELDGPVLGVAWDGSGWGPDGTVWGGEFLQVNEKSFVRVAHLRTFRLPGGETAVRQPRRSALGVLYEIFGEKLFSMSGIDPLATFDANQRRILQQMLERKINTPVTSSAGRLFDAVSSILGLCQVTSFEGQAAMKLEFETDDPKTENVYEFEIYANAALDIVDWEPMIRAIIDDMHASVQTELIAAKFHNTLVEMIIEIANRIGEKKVILTGGCFQNRYLMEHAVRRLEASGFAPFWHRRIPPNDGGIALGQIMAASRNSRENR